MTEESQNPFPPVLLARKGRGALSNAGGRFESTRKELADDGWGSLDDLPDKITTVLHVDTAKSVISYNQSPDVPFDRSINPYRGCEHGCVYCFARPTHAYLGLSPGLDFETRLFYKPDAPQRLIAELASPRYQPAPIALGINTDAYQPVERQLGLTRKLLGILHETRHPVSIVTKSALIERDLDLLADMARQNLVQVAFSITTLNTDLARKLEPRATAPLRRLQAVSKLAGAGVPVSLLVAPLIPVLNDAEMETIMAAARQAGALDAGYVLLRLPHELHELFSEWLTEHEPLKAKHILQRIYDARGGKAYDSRFGKRMTGEGEYANMLAQRFRLALKKLKFPGLTETTSAHFKPPRLKTAQMDLFDDL